MIDKNKVLDFLSSHDFEWDAEKRRINLAKHGIDFEDAIEVFYGPIVLQKSDRNNEERWTALGKLGERLIVVVFTWRGDAVRLISARRARTNEEREYRNQKMGRPSQGQD